MSTTKKSRTRKNVLPEFRNLGKVVFDSSRPHMCGEANGYNFNCVLSLCPECAEPKYMPDVKMNQQCGPRKQHEDRSDLWLLSCPVFFDDHGKLISADVIWPIGSQGDTDSPTHCDGCGALMVEPLSADGQDYVRDFCKRSRSPLSFQYRKVYDYLFK